MVMRGRKKQFRPANSADGCAPELRRLATRYEQRAYQETATLTQELRDIVESGCYLFSPRIRTLRGILAKLRPERVRFQRSIPSTAKAAQSSYGEKQTALPPAF